MCLSHGCASRRAGQVEIKHRSARKVSIADLEEMEDEEETILSQFKGALTLNGGEDHADASILDCIMHYLAVGWKVLDAVG